MVMVLAAAGILAGCTLSGRPDPQALIGQAVRATQGLQSVDLDLQANIRLANPTLIIDGTLTATGAMIDGGKTLAASVSFVGDVGQSTANQPFSATVDVSYSAQGDVLARLSGIEGQGLQSWLPPAIQAAMMQRWVRVVRGSTGALVTPEPQLLTVEAEALEVTEDMGDEIIGTTQTVHYALRLDPKKLRAYMQRAAADRGQTFSPETFEAELGAMDATGEVWIDPKTAYVHRLRWQVSRDGPQPVAIDALINLSHHNAATRALKPTNVMDWFELLTQAATASSASSSSSSSSSSLDAPDA